MSIDRRDTSLDGLKLRLRTEQRKVKLRIDQFRQTGFKAGSRELAGARLEFQQSLHLMYTEIDRLQRLIYPLPVVGMTEADTRELVSLQYADKMTARADKSMDSVLAGNPLLRPFTRLADESDPTENSAAYTEVDASNLITLNTASKVTLVGTQGTIAYLYKDYGVGVLGDTAGRTFKVTISAGADVDCVVGACLPATVAANLTANPQDVAGCMPVFTGGNYQLFLRRYLNAVATATDAFIGAAATPYFLTESRSGTSLVHQIYDAVERTGDDLLDTTGINDAGTNRRYALWVSTRTAGTAGRRTTIVAEDWDLGMAAAGCPAAYFLLNQG